MSLLSKSPSGDLNYRFDWTDQLPDGVTLVDVTHTVPLPLVLEAESTNSAGAYSTVRVSGGVHGQLFQVNAVAELSNSEEIPGSFTLRILAGT
jgi:hypothetical protein